MAGSTHMCLTTKKEGGVELQWEGVRLGRPAPVAYRPHTDEKP